MPETLPKRLLQFPRSNEPLFLILVAPVKTVSKLCCLPEVLANNSESMQS